MPHFKTITISDGLIGIWKLTETTDDLFPGLSTEELDDQNFQKYTHEKRKVEWMVTRILIKQLIGPDFTITYSGTGKPNISHLTYKQLSISHSRDFVAVILHKFLNVGIDIENINRNYIPIEKKYLSDDELVHVNQIPTLQCLYWCTKEAVFKLVPDDGVEFRHQIRISPFDPELSNEFSARYITKTSELAYPIHFQLFSDHCLVWVTDEPLVQT